MECPKCHSDNETGAKFCNECGAKPEIACSECGRMNRPGSKFCNECGHNLTLPSEPIPKDFSFDEKLDKIQRYLPKGLTGKILSQRDRIEGERKQVTVMFCDMEGLRKKKQLPGENQPHYFKIVSDFPMTRSGKIQKFRLGELAQKEYAAGD